MARLHTTHLSKTYKDRQVVSDVSMEINSGEIVGLLGPNGAGKTTSFYMVLGLVLQDQGRIFIDDQDISYEPINKRAEYGIGYLPQEASIFRGLSVEKNIYSILQLNKKLNRKQRKAKLAQLLAEFNIEHLRRNSGQSLSGGERRRVEIARALAADPKFILLDEPFAGVDPISVNDIKNLILHLKQAGLGVLITDHNVRETLDVCERAYILNSGSIIVNGTPAEILDNEQVKKVYLGEQFRL